ncbi:MAG: hypothetical protein ACOYXC_03355 [Candidatus Rifleibacteriota bacterium]
MFNIRGLSLLLMVTGLCFSFSAEAQTYDPPVRLVASADVQRLSYGNYVVREFLDIYNDDYNRVLTIKNITADSYRGHKKHRLNESWFEMRGEVAIPPASVKRMAERKRVVHGRKGRNWYIRRIKFTVQTDWGVFDSNFAASPFNAPEVVIHELDQNQLDSLSEPSDLTPNQKRQQSMQK